MARKKTAVPMHLDAEGAQGGGQEGHGKITKSEAVRRALADGVDQPADGVAYIKDNFGLEIGPGHFSAVKAGEKKKGEKPKGKPGRKSKAAVEGYLAPPPKPAAKGETDLLAAMEAMKPLVASLGADKVKRIVDLLG
jgi:hypothetical protein